jgi:plastocyanin
MKLRKCLPLLAVLLILFCSSAAYAAQSSLRVEPGYFYIFTGGDERAISYISVTGGGRYEYAVESAEGEILDYGVANRSPVRGGGRTYISATASTAVTVSYDSAKVKVTSEEGQALTRISLNKGETASITNNFDKQLTLTVDNTGRDGYAAYDSAVRNGWGDIVIFQRESKLTIQNIPSASSATFTAGEGGLTLMVPGVWIDREISWERDDRTALTSHQLTPGQAVALTNEGSDSYETVVFLKGGSFEYDYLLKDAQGFTVEAETGIKNNRIRVNANSTLIVTPKVDGALLYYPTDWTRDMTVQAQGSVSDSSYTVAPGKTLVITNSDKDYPHNVRIENQRSGENFKFDYSLTDGESTNYISEHSAGEISLPPETVLTLTARDDALIVRLPSAISNITAASGDKPAISYYTAEPKQTLVITNADAVNPHSVRIVNAQTGRSFKYDYSLTVEDSITFASQHSAGELQLPAGGALMLTALEETLVVMLPSAITQLSVTEGTADAVLHYTARPGSTLVITNSDQEDPHSVKIENAQPGRSFKYDYALEADSVTTYASEHSANEMSLPPDSTLSLTAGDEELIVSLPSALTSVNVSTGAKTAVSYYTAEPGRTLVITNSDTENSHAVRIENAKTGRSFKYDYALEEGNNVNYSSEHSAGEMSLPPSSVLTLTAREDSLVVRLPSSTTQIRVAEGTTPALFYAQIDPDVSFIAGNRGNKDVTVSAERVDETGRWDYLRRGADGEIAEYGRIGIDSPYTLKPRETTHFTNTEDFTLKFIFPSSLVSGGLYASTADAPALYRSVLSYGEAVAVTNTDKTYGNQLTLAIEEGSPSGRGYDYSFTDTKGELLEYGQSAVGLATIKNNQIMKISAQKGSELSVFYPYEMHEKVFTAAESDAPLHRITLAPGDRVTFTNRSRSKTYLIQNNSGEGLAAYYLRDKNNRTSIGRNEEPVIGDINIPVNDTVTITAAAGDDFELWMPVEWVNELIR